MSDIGDKGEGPTGSPASYELHPIRDVDLNLPGARSKFHVESCSNESAAGQAVMGLAMACQPSVDWYGYWQRAER
jgi:hypothetical protein